MTRPAQRPSGRRPRLSLLALLTTACASTAPLTPPPPVIQSVGTVDLERATVAPNEERLLNVGIEVFDNRVSPEESAVFGDWVFSEIRDNERHYLPSVLRNVLIDSNQWGAVRVLPEADPSVDLVISGTVLQSNGQTLQINIRASDSTGRVWLDRDYADVAVESDYPETSRFTAARRFDTRNFTEPFQDLYAQINNDLVALRNTLNDGDLTEIQRVSTLVYAADLAPATFGPMLRRDEQGGLGVISLPAANDPMLRRVEDMRLRHHLFVDTVDEYYEALHDDMRPSYLLWRKYSRDQIQEDGESGQRTAANQQTSRGFQTLRQRYDRYRWSKIYQQEFRELASGFNREVAPAILELNEQVHGLTGTMEEQYVQWRRILRQLFALETFGTQASPPL